ncbi:MAG: hypothetical protein JSR54_13965 [Proteobacteria bacterium]|nr:hypothetical protein [Pseudomonadota bacterium]
MQLDSSPVTYKTLGKLTARIHPGTMVSAAVIRGGDRVRLPLTIGQLPDSPATDAAGDGGDTWVSTLGFGVAETTPSIRAALHANDEPGGLIVTQVRPSGAGALAGLRVGDLVTHAGTEQLTTTEQLVHAMAPSEEVPLLLRVVRSGVPRFVAVTGTAQP